MVMTFELVAEAGAARFDLPDGRTLVLGRGQQCDIPVLDVTISRRHAELTPMPDGVRARDLGSSNGTFLNGRRMDSLLAVDGDVLTFGKVSFAVRRVLAPAQAGSAARPDDAPAAPPAVEQHPLASATILRARPVGAPGGRVRPLRSGSTGVHASPGTPADGADTAAESRVRRRLELLVGVAHALGRARHADDLLRDVVGMVFEILEADRVAILLVGADGELSPAVARNAAGQPLDAPVPRSIASRVVEERVAILSDDAPEDQRFGGASIIAQQVRSAMCAPLPASDGTPLGVLYVDNLTLTHRYGDDDLDFVIAFAGLAGVALENNRMAERIRREALVRANFERYFAPALAERIAEDPDAARLGGERRRVAVLFSDIRAFTTLAESMVPDEVAALLSEYFTRMVECVFAHGGTLDKFIGDAILAQWGAPIGSDRDAERALAAAIAMREELARLNEEWRSRGRPGISVGTGLSYGEVFAGNIGSERRMEYTIIGDTVNVASRLSAVAAGGEILVTDELRCALRTPPAMEECPPLALRGRSHPVPVYRVAAR